MTEKVIKRKSEWETQDPTLDDLVIGFEGDTGQFKIGDGIKPWSELPYAEVDFKNLISSPILTNPTLIGGQSSFATIQWPPNIWAPSNFYPAGDKVLYEGLYYQALQTVPSGTQITNTDYWELVAPDLIEHNCSLATTWFYLSNPPSNFTANFTNVVVRNNSQLFLQLIIDNTTQPTNAGRIPLNIQINDMPVNNISWFRLAARPTQVANGISVVSYKFIRNTDQWIGFAKLETFGRESLM
jgi:hypothetical protein